MIRPVKPVAPPPPPSPPRRMPSNPAPHGPAIENDEHELSTASFQDPPTMAAARQRIHEIARELPSQYDRLPRFDDETQARPVDGGLIMASRHRHDALDVPYEALPSLEVPRAYDEYEARFGEHDPETQLRPGYDSFSAAPVARRYVDSGEQVRDEKHTAPPPAKYNTHPYGGLDDEDSGPRQRPRKDAAPVPLFDAAAYEANYPGALRDDRDDSYPGRAESYKAPRREDDYRRDSAPPAEPARREESYRSASGRSESWSAPAPAIPAAPAVPREMKVPAGFVMGVQPLRQTSVAAPMPFAATPLPEAFPPAQGRARTPMMGVPYGQPQPGMTAAASPRAVHASAQQVLARPQTNNPAYAQPVGHQLQMTDVEEAQQGSKAGRFAWFVFGAAFGIFFAFFATGFASRLGKKEEIAFPPPAQLPTQPQAPVAVAPPPAQPPAPAAQPPALPIAAQQPAPPVAQPLAAAPASAAPTAAAPAAPPVAAPAAPSAVAAAPAAAPQVVADAKPAEPKPAAAPRGAAPAPAPPPRGQRAATIARRNAPLPPVSTAPKALPNSGSVEADDDAPVTHSSRTASAPSAPSKDKGADISGIGDLLSAGLGP